MSRRGAIFDLGGVVLDSPLDAIRVFEERHRIPVGTVNRTVVGSGANGAWARHERGEIDRDSFLDAFAAEFETEIDVHLLMDRIDDSIRVRPAVVLAIDGLRRRGVRVAALTNNWTPFGRSELVDHFDVVVESVVEGTRKPEQRIYDVCVERLGVPPEECVMFDDLGPNLKPARAMGMETVKVTGPEHVLEQISTMFD